MPEQTDFIDPKVVISVKEYERLKAIEARARAHTDSINMTKVSILANQILGEN